MDPMELNYKIYGQIVYSDRTRTHTCTCFHYSSASTFINS